MRKIYFKNDLNMIKEVDVGFSWGVFWFGILIPLLNGDYRNACIMLAINIGLCLTVIGIPFVLLANLIYACFYNEWHMTTLMKQGYKRIDKQ